MPVRLQRPGATGRAGGHARSFPMPLPVFVINLDRRPDRWAAISNNLDRIGVSATRVPAIDAPDVTGPFADDLSLAQAACLKSHLTAMQRLLETSHPAALILEDDAELVPEVYGLLRHVDWWPVGAHAVKLDGDSRGKPMLLGPIIGRTPCGKALRPIKWSRAVACSYMIDRAGAEIVLRMADDTGMTADSLLFHMVGSPVARLLKPAQVVRGMARHGAMGSDINTVGTTPRALPYWRQLLYKMWVLGQRATGRLRRSPVPFSD